MPRGPRLTFGNAFYHVFNRGINKQPIFLEDSDYLFFQKKLKKLEEKYDHSIYAYCLMPNHFHISIQARKDPISKIMSSLSTSYSMYFNKKYKHYGPVFQNRFKSILIQNDAYFLILSRYIYLNPTKAGLSNNPFEYPYSGLKELFGKESLYILDEDVMRLVGTTPQDRKSYQQFIYDGMKKDLSDIATLFDKEESILGSARFATSIQRKIRSK